MSIGKKGLSLGCRKRPNLKLSAKEVLLGLNVYIVNAAIWRFHVDQADIRSQTSLDLSKLCGLLSQSVIELDI